MEVEYIALQQLLEDISQYMKDFATAKELQKRLNKKKGGEDKKKGEELKKAVMEGQASIYTSCLCSVQKLLSHLVSISNGESRSNALSSESSPTLSVDEDNDVEELHEAEINESKKKKKRKIAMDMLGYKKFCMYTVHIPYSGYFSKQLNFGQ